MSFIASILAQVIEWFLGRLGSLAAKKIEEIEEDEAIKSVALVDEKQLESAQTDEEKKNAAEKLARDTFSS